MAKHLHFNILVSQCAVRRARYLGDLLCYVVHVAVPGGLNGEYVLMNHGAQYAEAVNERPDRTAIESPPR